MGNQAINWLYRQLHGLWWMFLIFSFAHLSFCTDWSNQQLICQKNLISIFGRKYFVCPVFTALFSNDIKKSLLAPWKIGYITLLSENCLCACVGTSYWYLIEMIALFTSVFNYCNNFVLSWVDRVITTTRSFKFFCACWIHNSTIHWQA